MKNMIHLKEALVSKEAFSRENSQMGGFEILIELVRKNFRGGGTKILAFNIFSRDADSQLGRGGGPKKMSA